MSKKLITLVFATFLTGIALSLMAEGREPLAQNTSQGTVAALDEAALQSRIDALMAMPAAQRRAELKSLSQEERRQLWVQLKRTQAEKRRLASASAASGSEGATRPYRSTQRNAALPQPKNSLTRAVGTIQYDDNVITTSFGGGAIIGNRFNTHTGGVQVTASGTVSTVAAVVVPGGAFTTSSAGFVLLGPQTVGGGAFAIFSSFTGATGTVDTVTFPGLAVPYTGSSFFVLFGDFANSYVPAFGTGSTNGQGFHGVVGYTGGMGPNITSTFDFGGTLNGLVRVTGNVLPVELMSFEVE